MKLTKKHIETIEFIKNQINIDLMPIATATKRKYFNVALEINNYAHDDINQKLKSLGSSSGRFTIEINGANQKAITPTA